MPNIDAPRPAERSWWLEEALARPEFLTPETTPLQADTSADVVILGGGYTGMWTAWFLRERRPELDVVLLEADICGGGPSGRNGGFCDGWWEKIRDVREIFGDPDAMELLMTSAAGGCRSFRGRISPAGSRSRWRCRSLRTR